MARVLASNLLAFHAALILLLGLVWTVGAMIGGGRRAHLAVPMFFVGIVATLSGAGILVVAVSLFLGR